MESSAIPIRPSRRCSQETCDPSPGTSPNARTSKMPPIDSLRLRRTLISSTIAREASASRQRTGDASTPAKSENDSVSRSGARTEPICVTCDTTSTPSARRSALASAPPATRAAVSRALARSSTLRTSVKPNFCTPARSAWPGRGRCTSGTSASTGHGFIRSSQLAKSRLATCSATGPPSVRPWRTPPVTSARSRSIFMRPPRPWPSWRRAMSRSIASRSSTRPAGRPSTTQVRPGPCDSPAVMSFSAIGRRSVWMASGSLGAGGLPGPDRQPGQGARDVGRRGGGGAVVRGARLALLGRADEHAAVGQPAVGRGALEGRAADAMGLAQNVGAGVGVALVGRRGGGRGARALLEHLDDVELVLDGLAVDREVEELGVALLDLDRLAALRARAAVPVAGRGGVRGEQEDRGLAVLQDAGVDEEGVVGRRQRREARDVVVGLQLRGLGAAEAQRQVVDVERVARRRRGLGAAVARAAGAARRVRRLGALRAAGARPGRLVGGRRLGRRSRRRGGRLGDVQLLEGVAHGAGAVVAGRAAVDLDGRLGHLAGVGLKGGRGQRGLIGGGAAEVHRDRDRRGEQQHGDRPQLALDEVAQDSADGAHPVTSEAVGAGLAAPPALEPEPVDPAAAVAAAPVPAEEVLASAAGRRYAVATTLALTFGKPPGAATRAKDRKSTRLNSSHMSISYA